MTRADQIREEMQYRTGQATLATFARDVLEELENTTDWDADMLDRIAQSAVDLGLAHTNPDGMFHQAEEVDRENH